MDSVRRRAIENLAALAQSEAARLRTGAVRYDAGAITSASALLLGYASSIAAIAGGGASPAAIAWASDNARGAA